MIREFIEERRRRRYFDSVIEINNEIFHNHQRKLMAIKVANAFSDIEELEEIIEQGQEAIDYFTNLHNENIQRLEALRKEKAGRDNKVVGIKEKEASC